MSPNCERCAFRRLLAWRFDLHVWREDCPYFETAQCAEKGEDHHEQLSQADL